MWESFVEWVSAGNGSTGAIITASAALIVFLLGKIYEIFDRAWRENKGHRRLILAIYLELRHNVADLKKIVSDFESDEEKSKHVSDTISKVEEVKGRTIHAVYYKGMRFIKILEKELHTLKPEVLNQTLRFYSELEFIYASLDGFQLDSFKTATTNGKKIAYRGVIDSERDAINIGNHALNAFQNHYGFLKNIN